MREMKKESEHDVEDLSFAASCDEWAWNDATGSSGGGVSDYFPQPWYQIDANVPVSVNDGHRGRLAWRPGPTAIADLHEQFGAWDCGSVFDLAPRLASTLSTPTKQRFESRPTVG